MERNKSEILLVLGTVRFSNLASFARDFAVFLTKNRGNLWPKVKLRFEDVNQE